MNWVVSGIYSVNVDFEQQKVTVWGICDRNDVLNAIKSKRRGARFWGSEEISEGPRPKPLSSSTRSWSWKAWKMGKILLI